MRPSMRRPVKLRHPPYPTGRARRLRRLLPQACLAETGHSASATRCAPVVSSMADAVATAACARNRPRRPLRPSSQRLHRCISGRSRRRRCLWWTTSPPPESSRGCPTRRAPPRQAATGLSASATHFARVASSMADAAATAACARRRCRPRHLLRCRYHRPRCRHRPPTTLMRVWTPKCPEWTTGLQRRHALRAPQRTRRLV